MKTMILGCEEIGYGIAEQVAEKIKSIPKIPETIFSADPAHQIYS